MTLMNSIRMALRRVGIESYRATPMTMFELRLPRLLAEHHIKTVFDVGANDGGFATQLIRGGFKGEIVSFEPLPDAWQKLSEKARAYPTWNVAPPVALSDKEGEASFNQAGNSTSSSLMAMTDAHTDAAPHSATERTLTIRTTTLDRYVAALASPGKCYLKIDVQGAERLVLDGATDALQGLIVGVQLEMSLVELYEGQPLAMELHAYLTSRGFQLWDIVPGFRSTKTLQLLQYDGIYFKTH